MPRENTKVYIIGMGRSSIVIWNGACVMINTSTNARKENARFTSDESTLERGNIYFGTYIFLIIPSLLIIECMACVVDSLKKPKIICPLSR
jgi:hypothetical protein